VSLEGNPPLLSPSGKFYWDGEEWQPTPNDGVSGVPEPPQWNPTPDQVLADPESPRSEAKPPDEVAPAPDPPSERPAEQSENGRDLPGGLAPAGLASRLPVGPLPARSTSRKLLTRGLTAILVMAISIAVIAAISLSRTTGPNARSAPSAATSSAGATHRTPPRPAAQVAVSGRGAATTAKFELGAATYTVAYDFSGSCFYTAYLSSTDGTYSHVSLASGSGPTKGSVHLYGLLQGSYFVEFNTALRPDCPWSLTFTLSSAQP